MTSAEAWFSVALRPQKPEGSLGRKAQDGHLDFHTAPELCRHGLQSPTYKRVNWVQSAPAVHTCFATSRRQIMELYQFTAEIVHTVLC